MKKIIRTMGILISITLLLFWSCSKKNSGTNNYPGPGNSNSVSIYNMKFVSSNISIDKSVTVTWTNDDAIQHTVTADDNSFTSGQLNTGNTYSHTFNNSGTVAYHCAIHPSMKGSVVVK